ncbi:MAG: hypothetical protein M1834_009544 [Cirrosporium novae-zelandiae]|nr:MAG: hypothetical protein M1834_009544 [Cirrosporium novae-zelandiae]
MPPSPWCKNSNEWHEADRSLLGLDIHYHSRPATATPPPSPPLLPLPTPRPQQGRRPSNRLGLKSVCTSIPSGLPLISRPCYSVGTTSLPSQHVLPAIPTASENFSEEVLSALGIAPGSERLKLVDAPSHPSQDWFCFPSGTSRKDIKRRKTWGGRIIPMTRKFSRFFGRKRKEEKDKKEIG